MNHLITDGLENMQSCLKSNEINPINLSYRPQGRESIMCHMHLLEKQNSDNRKIFALEGK